MFIKKLKENIYDVFTDTQWDNWTRVRRFHWGVRVIAGKQLSREGIRELNRRLGII